MANQLSENSKIVQFAFDKRVSKEEQDLVFKCKTLEQAKEVLMKHRKERKAEWKQSRYK